MAEAAAPAPAAPSSSSAAINTPRAGAAPSAEAGSPAQGAAGGATGTPPAPSEPPKTWKQKINGKERVFTEQELLDRASQAEAAQQRFEEAAKMRKQAESVIGRLRDPDQVIEALLDPALGLSKDQIRAKFEDWYSKEFIEPEQLTPEQKKLREAEAKLQKYAQEEKDREAQKQRDQQEAMTAKARGEIQAQIIEALQTGGLPKTNFTLRRLAYWMQRNHANGFDAPTSVLVSQVRNEFNTSLRDMVEASDGEALIKLLGDGLVQKIRKYDLDQLRKLRNGGNPAPPAETAPPEQSRGRAPTSAEVNDRIRQLQRTGKY